MKKKIGNIKPFEEVDENLKGEIHEKSNRLMEVVLHRWGPSMKRK